MKYFNNKQISNFLPQLRIKSVYRYGLNSELLKQFKKLKPGIVLDICHEENLYKKIIPNKEYINLSISTELKLDIKYNSNYFDTVIVTHILEHFQDPQKAVNEIHRVLKKEGVCILSAPLIEHYHPNPKDYYRFTKDSLNYLFRNFRKVEIYHHGNKLQSIWQILNIGAIKIILNFFNPLIACIKSKKTRVPCGFVVYAEK